MHLKKRSILLCNVYQKSDDPVAHYLMMFMFVKNTAEVERGRGKVRKGFPAAHRDHHRSRIIIMAL